MTISCPPSCRAWRGVAPRFADTAPESLPTAIADTALQFAHPVQLADPRAPSGEVGCRPTSSLSSMRSRPTHDARKAEAFRLHLIASVFPVHVVGSVVTIVCAVVSKVRYPTSTPLFPSVPRSDFREFFTIVMSVLLSMQFTARAAYVENFETVCDTVNWLGMLARLSITRCVPSLPWGLFRFVAALASGIMTRYEFSKQWRHHVVRLFVSSATSVYVRRTTDVPEFAGETLVGAIVAEVTTFALLVPLVLRTQRWLELVDVHSFELRWARDEIARAQTQEVDQRMRRRAGDASAVRRRGGR